MFSLKENIQRLPPRNINNEFPQMLAFQTPRVDTSHILRPILKSLFRRWAPNVPERHQPLPS